MHSTRSSLQARVCAGCARTAPSHARKELINHSLFSSKFFYFPIRFQEHPCCFESLWCYYTSKKTTQNPTNKPKPNQKTGRRKEQARSQKFLVLALWEGRWEDTGGVRKIRKAQISNGSSIFSLVPVTSLPGRIKNQPVHRFGAAVDTQGL